MKKGKQADNSVSCVIKRKEVNACLLQFVSKQRLRAYRSSYSKGLIIAYFADRYMEERDDVSNYVIIRNEVFDIDYSFNFNWFTKLKCLVNFRFSKRDICSFLFQPRHGLLGRVFRSETDMELLRFSPNVCSCADSRHQQGGKIWLTFLKSGSCDSPKLSGNPLNIFSKHVCTWSPIRLTEILYSSGWKRMKKRYMTCSRIE